MIPTHYKYVFILALTTLKMATLMAETWRWSLYNKITFIKQILHLLVFLIEFHKHMMVLYSFQKTLELKHTLTPTYRKFYNSNNWICHLHVHAVKWEYIFAYGPTCENTQYTQQWNFHPSYMFWRSHCQQQSITN